MELASIKSINNNPPPFVAPLVAHSQHLLQPNGSILGRAVADSILPRFPDLLSAIPVSTKAALRCMDLNQPALSHSDIAQFTQQLGTVLHQHWKLGRGHRVAVVLPNGPELALAILAVSNYCCVVPLNAFGAVNELQADLQRAAVDCIISLPSHHASANPQIEPLVVQTLRLPFCALTPETGGLFSLATPAVQPVAYTPPRSSNARQISGDEADRSAGDFSPRHHHHRQVSNGSVLGNIHNDDDDDNNNNSWNRPNQHEDEVLVLFTSGTTGQKKLVPHLLQDVLVATACIAVSWKLTSNDTNCNLMPLFHVGGIIRQVYSPILSGGSVICCPAFDPATFWSLLSSNSHDNETTLSNTTPTFTWYYAAPTMHQLILQTGRLEGYISAHDGKCPRSMQLRMIANAAGGLLPSMARELRQAFRANVLPSYGMTECMPITSPPANYLLEKPGTSGVAVGPEIAILNTATSRRLQTGKEGPICVRGEPCFRGYGRLAGSNETNNPKSCFLKGGWFDTGDLGYMDADGYLYITGRSKEVINRGGK